MFLDFSLVFLRVFLVEDWWVVNWDMTRKEEENRFSSPNGPIKERF